MHVPHTYQNTARSRSRPPRPHATKRRCVHNTRANKPTRRRTVKSIIINIMLRSRSAINHHPVVCVCGQTLHAGRTGLRMSCPVIHLHLRPLSPPLRVCVLQLRRVFDLDVDAFGDARLHEVAHASKDLFTQERPKRWGCRESLEEREREQSLYRRCTHVVDGREALKRKGLDSVCTTCVPRVFVVCTRCRKIAPLKSAPM